MPIKWSALKVSQSLDEIEKLLHDAEPILMECCQKANETAELPKLAGYISEPLVNLAYEITDRLERYHQRIGRIRDYIPKADLAKEQGRFEQWLSLCDGDREKAEQGMRSFL